MYLQFEFLSNWLKMYPGRDLGTRIFYFIDNVLQTTIQQEFSSKIWKCIESKLLTIFSIFYRNSVFVFLNFFDRNFTVLKIVIFRHSRERKKYRWFNLSYPWIIINLSPTEFDHEFSRTLNKRSIHYAIQSHWKEYLCSV